MSEFLALDLPELRRRMEDHKATRPTDVFSPEMKPWMKKKDSIAFAIELKEAEAAQKPFYITVPPQPIERPIQPLLRLRKDKTSKPITQEVRHDPSPGKAGAPGPPIKEAPMPRANPSHHRNPQDRVLHLVELIQAATQKGKKLYWAQQEVRDLCQAHGLEVPPEAQKRASKAAKQDAPPQHLNAATEGAMQPEPKPALPVQAAPERLQPLPEVAGRFRALRTQALELLPLCQGLSGEEAKAVERQIDLLADVLAVGVRLAHEVA